MSVEVFDRGLVSPRDLIDGHVEHGGDFLPFGGRGGPAAEGDRRHPEFIEAGAFGQLGDRDLLRFAKFGDVADHDSDAMILYRGMVRWVGVLIRVTF
jgi:hypothetical protein